MDATLDALFAGLLTGAFCGKSGLAVGGGTEPFEGTALASTGVLIGPFEKGDEVVIGVFFLLLATSCATCVGTFGTFIAAEAVCGADAALFLKGVGAGACGV